MNATYTSLPSGEIAIHGLSVNDAPRARRKSWKPVHVPAVIAGPHEHHVPVVHPRCIDDAGCRDGQHREVGEEDRRRLNGYVTKVLRKGSDQAALLAALREVIAPCAPAAAASVSS